MMISFINIVGVYLISLAINWVIMLVDWRYLSEALHSNKTLKVFAIATVVPGINTITAAVLISWLVLVILFEGTHLACRKVEFSFKGTIALIKNLKDKYVKTT